MITKINRGNDLGATLRYVYREDATPEVVAGTAVGSSREQIERDMMKAIDRRADLKNPVVHMILSIPKEEHLTPIQWGEVAQDYTERMGFGKAPYIAVRHQDTEHEHIHIVASRVDVFGRPIRLSHDYYKSQEIARDLEQKYELGRVRSSWERETKDRSQGEYHLTQRTGEETRKERVRRELFGALEQCKDVPELASKLREKDIELVPKVTSDQSKVVGVVFKVEGWHIPGSRIDRGLSWNQIAEKLEYEHARDFSRLSAPPAAPARATGEVNHASPKTQGRESAAELMRPVVPEPVPQESTQEKRQRVHNELQAALEKAPYHKGWEAWTKALKEQEIEAIPKGTQSEEGKLRGMYFEKEGVRLPGSSVDREYSFGNLERRLGAYEQERDSAAFTRVHIPGVGDQAMPSRMEQAYEKAPAVVQTPSPEASRSRAPEHGARSIQQPQMTPEERKERMVNDMRHALENATVDQGWKAWTRSLREQGVEAIPKGTQDDPGRLRGMYFERRGVRVPGSEVGRAYSFGNLEKTLGGYDQARDLSAFRRVHVPGVGDLATHRVRPQAQHVQREHADRQVQQAPKRARVPSPEQVVRAAQHSMDRTADEELVRRLQCGAPVKLERQEPPRKELEQEAVQRLVDHYRHDGQKGIQITPERFEGQLRERFTIKGGESWALLEGKQSVALVRLKDEQQARGFRQGEWVKVESRQSKVPDEQEAKRKPRLTAWAIQRMQRSMDQTADEELVQRLQNRPKAKTRTQGREEIDTPKSTRSGQRETVAPGPKAQPNQPGEPVLSRAQIDRKLKDYYAGGEREVRLRPDTFVGKWREGFRSEDGQRWGVLEDKSVIAVFKVKEETRFMPGARLELQSGKLEPAKERETSVEESKVALQEKRLFEMLQAKLEQQAKDQQNPRLQEQGVHTAKASEALGAPLEVSQWVSEARARGEHVRLLEPTQRVRGVVEDKSIELKEGTFHVIRTRENERVLVQDTRLGEFKGEKATAYVNPSGRTFVESLERDRDR